MLKFIALPILYFTFVFFGAVSTVPANLSHDAASDEIRSTWSEFIESWEMKDAERCAAFYAENGLNIPPGMELLKGSTEIESFYRSLFDSNASSTYEHTIHDLQIFGDHAIEYGEFRVDWVPYEGDNWTFHARSFTHWIKLDTGEWKIEKLLYNTPPAVDQ